MITLNIYNHTDSIWLLSTSECVGDWLNGAEFQGNPGLIWKHRSFFEMLKHTEKTYTAFVLVLFCVWNSLAHVIKYTFSILLWSVSKHNGPEKRENSYQTFVSTHKVFLMDGRPALNTKFAFYIKLNTAFSVECVKKITSLASCAFHRVLSIWLVFLCCLSRILQV